MLATSIVVYDHSYHDIEKTLLSLLCYKKTTHKIYIVDNSKHDALKQNIILDEKYNYILSPHNLGYGTANNIAIKKSIEDEIKYHLVLNPDVYFDSGVLETLFEYMESHPEVGLVMPKVLYPDGNTQYLCKLLPTPFDMLLRRFVPFVSWKEKRNEIYELKFTGYDTEMEVPCLSGCFMFLRVSALQEVGIFDERYFLYGEDTDLSRRIHQRYKTVYLPEISITHVFRKTSYKSLKMTLIHLRSMIQYFNKWGWLFDKERTNINLRTLEKLKKDDN
jgi:GT2 family glycosyltransferase